MIRRLDPDEAALWARVAGGVRPLKGRAGVAIAGVKRPKVAVEVRDTAPEPPRVSKAALAQPLGDAGLDGGWDRKVTRGRIVPDRAIDLHGLSRTQAHALLVEAIERGSVEGARVLLVVTGKGRRDGDGGMRGVIRDSLSGWLETPGLRPYVAAVRSAHPRHGGAGAWYVVLRRRR